MLVLLIEGDNEKKINGLTNLASANLQVSGNLVQSSSFLKCSSDKDSGKATSTALWTSTEAASPQFS